MFCLDRPGNEKNEKQKEREIHMSWCGPPRFTEADRWVAGCVREGKRPPRVSLASSLGLGSRPFSTRARSCTCGFFPRGTMAVAHTSTWRLGSHFLITWHSLHYTRRLHRWEHAEESVGFHIGSRKDFITYRINSKKVCIEQSLYKTESYHYSSSVHIPRIFFLSCC